MLLITVSILILSAIFHHGFAQLPCSDPLRRYNLGGCLNWIRMQSDKVDAFWFGRMFDTGFCSRKEPRFSECVDGQPLGRRQYLSLGSRIFQDDNYDSAKYLDKLCGFPMVTYRSAPGSYHGCNTTAYSPTTIQFEAFPGMGAVGSWFVRSPPQLYLPNCNYMQLCAVFFYDAGHGVLHNMWLNWPKETNISNYVPPVANVRSPTPYVFIYYYQQGEIRDFFPATPYNPWQFNLQEFVQRFNLTGPAGINWLRVVADPYSLKQLRDTGLMNNCPTLLVQALQNEYFRLSNDLELSEIPEFDMWVTVRFDVQNSFEPIWVDPIKNVVCRLDSIRNQPEVTLSHRLLQPNAAEDFAGQQFTMVMVEFGPTTAPVIMNQVFRGQLDYSRRPVAVHWVVTNIQGPEASQGQTAVKYEGAPLLYPREATKQYYILVYRQRGSVDTIRSWLENRECLAQQSNGCHISFTLFARDHSLDLVGLSQFRVVG